MGFDRFFGFNLQQRKTLQELGLTPATAELLATIAALPTVDPEDGETIWNDGGVLKVASTV